MIINLWNCLNYITPEYCKLEQTTVLDFWVLIQAFHREVLVKISIINYLEQGAVIFVRFPSPRRCIVHAALCFINLKTACKVSVIHWNPLAYSFCLGFQAARECLFPDTSSVNDLRLSRHQSHRKSRALESSTSPWLGKKPKPNQTNNPLEIMNTINKILILCYFQISCI